METRIWYFENSQMGVVVGNITSFEIWKEDKGITFNMLFGYHTTITDTEDVANFKKNILR